MILTKATLAFVRDEREQIAVEFEGGELWYPAADVLDAVGPGGDTEKRKNVVGGSQDADYANVGFRMQSAGGMVGPLVLPSLLSSPTLSVVVAGWLPIA